MWQIFQMPKLPLQLKNHIVMRSLMNFLMCLWNLPCYQTDLHTLNANINVDQYPIPHINDLLNWLHGIYMVLKIDICAG